MNGPRVPKSRPCPEGAALIIKGEHFPCDAMDGIHKVCSSHKGWPHSNRKAEAVWGLPNVRALGAERVACSIPA